VLAIRLQRRGRSGHANFRVIVQDSRWSPKSGKTVDQLGSYDPHTKAMTLDKDKAEIYLKNGAQPSERLAMLLKKEGVKLPAWVEKAAKKEGKLRNPEKLRKNRPVEEKPAPAPVSEEQPIEEATKTAETPNEEPSPPVESTEIPNAIPEEKVAQTVEESAVTEVPEVSQPAIDDADKPAES